MGVSGSSSLAIARPATDRSRLLISVIVPTLNEESHIGPVIDDMLGQEDLDADVEVLVADGGSKDRTRAIVAKYARRGNVRLIDNPKRHQVHGYNLAIRAARGSIICIIHAHARFSKTYLAACLDARERTGAANVGGVISHRGDGLVGEAIALAMSSPLGVGDSKYRHATREQWCDSVMGTFIDRRLFDEVGFYNETNIVNEDLSLTIDCALRATRSSLRREFRPRTMCARRYWPSRGSTHVMVSIDVGLKCSIRARCRYACMLRRR